MNSINVTRFIKLQKVILKTYEKAAEAAARRSGISVDEAEALIYLYEKPEHKGKLNDIRLSEVQKTAEALTADNMAVINGDEISLTGKGGIAAKSVSMSVERFFSHMLDGISPEEQFIVESVLEKMYKNIENN